MLRQHYHVSHHDTSIICVWHPRFLFIPEEKSNNCRRQVESVWRIFKRGHWRQITHHCQFEGLCWAWRRHMEGMMWRGSLSLLPSESRWFLRFTSTSNSLRIIKACVNSQSNEGLWPTERKAQFGTYFLHTWGAGAGACSGGCSRMFQRRKVLPLQVSFRHHRSSRRTWDRLRPVWTKIIYRDWWPVATKAEISASTG